MFLFPQSSNRNIPPSSIPRQPMHNNFLEDPSSLTKPVHYKPSSPFSCMSFSPEAGKIAEFFVILIILKIILCLSQAVCRWNKTDLKGTHSLLYYPSTADSGVVPQVLHSMRQLHNQQQRKLRMLAIAFMWAPSSEIIQNMYQIQLRNRISSSLWVILWITAAIYATTMIIYSIFPSFLQLEHPSRDGNSEEKKTLEKAKNIFSR